MTNTATSFRDKWEKNQDLAFQETLREGSEIYTWILQRNGFTSGDDLREFLADKQRILDAGCGNGRVTALLDSHAPKSSQIVGIDLVAADVAAHNLAERPHVQVLAKDLLGDLDDLGTFDFIYCQEVLHHTSDPAGAFSNLCGLLNAKGEIAIYVYKQKAPIREWTDDYVRDRISHLPYDEAIAICEQITAFGRALSDQNVRLQIPQVDVLDIPAGEYDLQRLIYHFFAKCFWNDQLSERENVVINYDWYHPQTCSRHTRDEVRQWFEAEGLEILHECVDFYGITMRGRRA